VNSTELRTMVTVAEARARARRADDLVREAADRAGLIDVAIGVVDSPLGELFVAVTRKGVACVGFDDQDRAALEDRFADGLSPRVVMSSRVTDDVRKQLDEYFGGARRDFDIAVDHRLMSPFVRKVMAETAKVPYGEVSTYGRLAILRRRARSGRPSARIRSRSFCRATASSAPRASSSATPVAFSARSSFFVSKATPRCSPVDPRDLGRRVMDRT
jgi:methylated-DNA-[protein]-cysteine S-methyltransferase